MSADEAAGQEAVGFGVPEPAETRTAPRAALEAKAAEGVPGAVILLRRLRDHDMRREIILREINQGALAGLASEIGEQAADLVIGALDRYDASREKDYWQSHPWECVPLSLLKQAVESRKRWQAKAQEAMDLRTYPDAGGGE